MMTFYCFYSASLMEISPVEVSISHRFPVVFGTSTEPVDVLAWNDFEVRMVPVTLPVDVLILIVSP